MPLTGILKSWFRFLLYVLPRAAAGQYTASRMAGYAIEFLDGGNRRLANWCLNLAVEKGLDDPYAFETALDMLLDAAQIDLAARFANTVFDETGVMPAEAARLAGEFFYGGDCSESLQMFDRLLERFQGNLDNAVPAPASSHDMDVSAVRERLAAPAAEPAPSELNLSLARLCFRFSAFDTAAKLFGQEERNDSIGVEDQIAFAYSLLRSGRVAESRTASEHFGLGLKAIDVDPDWRMLHATLMFAFGATASVRSAVRTCLRSRLSKHPDFPDIVRYCDQIVDSIMKFPEQLTIAPMPGAGDRHAAGQGNMQSEGRLKIFICGNGWSGSGALVDALADLVSVAVAPDMPIDRFINKDTNDELMFVQGEGGVGRLWRRGREYGRIARMDLWELFRCHVVGMGAIGYTEHKGANAASALLERHGGRFAREFRNLFVQLTGLDDGASLVELRHCLNEFTDALTELIFDARADQCVAFNNAMFGANLDMVEVFTNFRLAVVVRDPLDQYADRRANDLKHWMTSRRFVSFYKSGRNAFHACRDELSADLATRVREVEFERLVQDTDHREGVLDWMLDGRSRERVASSFDPAKSSANIGIHEALLSDKEIALLDEKLGEWRSP